MITFAVDEAGDKRQMLNDYLEQFDIEVSRRAERMKSKVRFLKASISRQFTVEMTKIPKAVKEMTIAEFRAALAAENSATADGSFDFAEPSTIVKGKKPSGVRRSTRQSALQTPGILSTGKSTRQTNRVSFKKNTSFKEQQSSRRTTRSSAKQSDVFETPAAVRETGRLELEALGFDPRLPRTPYLRPARQGESLVSVNGSPVAVDVSTSRICRNPRQARSTIITVPLTSGKAVEINSDNPMALHSLLEGKDREEAVSELQRLQQQLASMIQTFQQPI
eukprot:m.151382 g.151382  ORF g.151382 m.151382 type:complete len:278 (-) comp16199_c4_seq1:96-929(-)